jgi:hypothetical protein
MLFWCNFCLAGSNLFETNNFIEFGFFLVWGDPSTSWTRSQRICTKKHVGISTVKCGWHLAFVSTLFEDHRRGPWQILTVEACLPCLKEHFASSQHPIAAATPAIRPLLWAGYAGNPAKGQRLMMTHATNATLRAAEWQLHVPRQISTHSPTVCNRIWFACIFFWQGPTNNHIESLCGSFAFGPMICNKSF